MQPSLKDDYLLISGAEQKCGDVRIFGCSGVLVHIVQLLATRKSYHDSSIIVVHNINVVIQYREIALMLYLSLCKGCKHIQTVHSISYKAWKFWEHHAQSTWQYSSWDFSLPPNVRLMQLFPKLHIAVIPKDYKEPYNFVITQFMIGHLSHAVPCMSWRILVWS